MKKIVFLATLPIFFIFGLLFTHTTCAYSIDTCAGLGDDGKMHTASDTICYYSIPDSPFFTSDANNACRRPGCPDLPIKTCDEMIKQDPNRNHNESSANVDTTVQGGSSCGNFFTNATAPYKCCIKSESLTPVPIAGTMKSPCPDGKCPTAIGLIDTSSPQNVVSVIFQTLLGISGGIAVILIMVSGYSLAFSQGNSEKVQAAREQLTAAIVGLLFIIFSVAILRIVGVDVLKIPGFR